MFPEFFRIRRDEVAGRDYDVGVYVVTKDPGFSLRVLSTGDHLRRVGYSAGNSAGCSNKWAREDDFAAGVTHAADEVAVAGGYAAFTVSQDTHVAAQAWTAGRSTDHGSRIYECTNVSEAEGISEDLPCSRDHDAANGGVYLSAPEHLRRLLQV